MSAIAHKNWWAQPTLLHLELSGVAVEQPEPLASIRVIDDDATAFETALRNVIDAIGNVQTRLAGHGVYRSGVRHFGIGRRITVAGNKSQPGPFCGW